MTDGNIYREKWNQYVRDQKPSQGVWPGDEWGNPALWESMFNQYFKNHGVAKWERAVEIGGGSGKYSLKVLEASKAHLLSCDISDEYQKVSKERLSSENLQNRVDFLLLDNKADTLHKALTEKGWQGKVDGFYSIDAMVHVDLQYLIVYLITANIHLRTGGTIVMTVANCCSEKGFEKMIRDIRSYYSFQGMPSAKFEWLSPQSIQYCLTQLGFQLEMMNTQARDIAFVATKGSDTPSWIVETIIKPV